MNPRSSKPDEIEEESFRIIESEIGEHGYSQPEWEITRRVIHATADFDFARTNKLIFQSKAVEKGVKALQNGTTIIADVEMVKAGINKPNLARLGTAVDSYINDPRAAEEAKKENTTRAVQAMRIATRTHPNGVYVIGNAPTALLELLRIIKSYGANPSLIVGVPVGFISASESKQELAKIDLPYITNIGRKGGSTVATAIINALMIIALRKTV